MSSNLVERIRSEAALADRPGQMERLEQIAEEVARLQRGAKTLGHVVEQQCRMVLDATGLHHFIGEDGDGDWGAVWDNLYDIRANALREAEEAVIAAAPPINSELLYDGREDPAAAAYVEGYKDAWQAVTNLRTPTTNPQQPRLRERQEDA
ncbi:MAG: hypothetical protein ACXVGA_08550 [Mycobacteriaceae bacterium]